MDKEYRRTAGPKCGLGGHQTRRLLIAHLRFVSALQRIRSSILRTRYTIARKGVRNADSYSNKALHQILLAVSFIFKVSWSAVLHCSASDNFCSVAIGIPNIELLELLITTPTVASSMPNQLSIPFKNTYPIPIRRAVREYILAHHTDTHPDAFKWDINRWEILRKDGTGGAVHVDRVKTVLRCVWFSVRLQYL